MNNARSLNLHRAMQLQKRAAHVDLHQIVRVIATQQAAGASAFKTPQPGP
jgi:hypothetical protein